MPNSNGYYTLLLRVDEDTFKLIEKLREETGLSSREILAYSSQPCSPCSEDVSAYNSKDRNVKIPRGILFNSLLTKYSSYKKHEKSD